MDCFAVEASFKYKKCVVTLKEGDILGDIRCDVLVHPSRLQWRYVPFCSWVAFNGAVGSLIRQTDRAAYNNAQTWKAVGEMRRNNCCMSEAPRVSFKNILHIQSSKNAQKVISAFKNAEQELREKGVCAMAIPCFASGHKKLKRKDSAKLTFDTALKFLDAVDIDSLQEIRIYANSPEMKDEVAYLMDEYNRQHGNCEADETDGEQHAARFTESQEETAYHRLSTRLHADMQFKLERLSRGVMSQ